MAAYGFSKTRLMGPVDARTNKNGPEEMIVNATPQRFAEQDARKDPGQDPRQVDPKIVLLEFTAN